MMPAKNYQRISKRKARRLYNQGKPLYFHTSKLLWNNPWQNPMPVVKNEEDEKSRKAHYQWCIDNNYHELIEGKPKPFFEQFDLDVSTYANYNCDKERGKRVIYLIDTPPASVGIRTKKPKAKPIIHQKNDSPCWRPRQQAAQ